MNHQLRLSVFALLVLAAFAATAQPVVVTLQDNPRIARHALAADAEQSALIKHAVTSLHAKGLQPAGTTLHPADVANSPSAANSWFGYATAASATHLVVSAPRMNAGAGDTSGQAYVFRRNGTELVLEATLAANDAAADDWFGYAVAIDGDTIMVSANRDDIDGKVQVGSVYVFERAGSNWTQVAKLFPPSVMANSNYGFSIDLEGERALVGAVSAIAPSFSGCVFQYRRINGVWTEQAVIVPANAQNAQWFGFRMAREGDTLAISAPQFDGPAANTGRVLIYERSGETWSAVTDLRNPASESGEWFGDGLELSGSVLAVGAFSRDFGSVQEAGALDIFRKQGGLWSTSPQQTLTAPTPVVADNYAWSIGLDGSTLWVAKIGSNSSRVLHTYRDNGAQWLPSGEYSPAATPSSWVFGSEIEVAADALFVSAERAPGEVTGLTWVGKLLAFQRTALITPQAGAGGSFSPSTPIERAIGQGVTLLVQPDAGHRSVAVSGCNGALDGQEYSLTAVDDCTVVASFANDAPQASAISAQSDVYEGESFSVTLTASDLETASLVYHFDCNGDAVFELGPQASHIGSCNIAQSGSHAVSARATDAGGLSAELGTVVSILNSQPTVSIMPPSNVDEDQPYVVAVDASVPSSGETISAIDVDCNYDGVFFTVDASTTGAGNVACPAVEVGGTHTHAARATDNEGEHSAITSANASITPINDAPTFTIFGDFENGPAYAGPVIIQNFLSNLSFGPADEQGQQISAITLTALSNPNGMVSNIAIDANGTLIVVLTGRAGVARYRLTVTDNGGTPGQPTSAAQEFNITNTPGTDFQVSLDDDVAAVIAGSNITYDILAANAGPNPADAYLQFAQPQGLTSMTWTCTAIENATCPSPSSGSGDIAQTLTLPINGLLHFEIQATVSAAPDAFINATATLAPFAGTSELDQDDNTASDNNAVVGIGIFSNGFETGSGLLRMLAPD